MAQKTLDHLLLVSFRSAEQAEEIRKFFSEANAFEFGAGIWLVPIAAHPDVFLKKLLQHVPSANEGVVVMSLARHVPKASIHNYPDLTEWFRSAREPGQ